ncbi:inovirus-type Gp2 protein [Pseudoalteromonas agarivorans]|uniref:YagK/YfjJ domain-containing protein n=1 Tax=Pseudoalteromonas agarivorans TaxID=176102 RepID=UPI003120426F
MTISKKDWDNQHKLNSKSFSYNGIDWLINSGRKGHHLNRRHLQSTIRHIDIMLSHYNRLFPVRLELHCVEWQSNNEKLTQFIKKAKRVLAKKYKVNKIGYIACRELETAKGPHYHIALLFDAKKVKSEYGVYEAIRDLWHEGKVSYTKYKEPLPVKRNDKASQAGLIYALSYMTKIRGKGYTEQNVQSFTVGRIGFASKKIGETDTGEPITELKQGLCLE